MVGEMMTSWVQLTDNCLSNTEAAVDVLSDLLNYDKVLITIYVRMYVVLVL
jgi:hypothetical protein